MKRSSVLFMSILCIGFLSLAVAWGEEQSFSLARKADHFQALKIVKVDSILARDFSLESLEGVRTKLSDLRGKVVFLNFWATWCGPCRAEVRDIDSLYSALKDESFTVLAVDIREDRDKVRSFMEKYQVDFPVYIDTTGEVAMQYGVSGIPTTFIVDPQGKIVGRALGPREWDSQESIALMRSLME